MLMPALSSGHTAHLPGQCERIARGVAKLTAFRLPPDPLKRRSEGTLSGLCSKQLRMVPSRPPPPSRVNFPNAQDAKPPLLPPSRLALHTNSANCLLLGTPQPQFGGKRLHSLDSAATLAVGRNDADWLRTQQMLVAEAAHLRRQREQSCCASVGASYAFLALSVALSFSVVIGVCLFLHSFVPKERPTKVPLAAPKTGITAVEEEEDVLGGRQKVSPVPSSGHQPPHSALAFAEQPIPVEYLLFSRRRRK